MFCLVAEGEGINNNPMSCKKTKQKKQTCPEGQYSEYLNKWHSCVVTNTNN